jgi:hypothetical protein
MLQSGRWRVRFPMRSLDFSFDLILPASDRSEYQESSWRGEGRPARKVDNLTTICEPIF